MRVSLPLSFRAIIYRYGCGRALLYTNITAVQKESGATSKDLHPSILSTRVSGKIAH